MASIVYFFAYECSDKTLHFVELDDFFKLICVCYVIVYKQPYRLSPTILPKRNIVHVKPKVEFEMRLRVNYLNNRFASRLWLQILFY